MDSDAAAAAPASLARSLARRERTVAVLTGPVDVVGGGSRVLAVANGHPLLAEVTGAGCVLGTCLSAALAATSSGAECDDGGDGRLAAVLAALLHFEIAAELAAERADSVRGPGSFVPALLDELRRLRDATVRGDVGWLARARVELVADDEE